jgi:DNA invertase Pin-like site-specific DNA recombinase
MPVVLYGRVSQARGDERSVDDQLRELRTWADREGWRVHAEHRDDGVSASRYAGGKSREGWEQVLDVIGSGAVRALLVWESSRATRDPAVHHALEEACRLHRVLYGYSGTLHDLGTAEGGFQAGLRALLDAQESAKISERTQRAANSRAAEGRPHGNVAFGYRRVIDEQTGRTVKRVEHEDNGPLVREMVRRVLDGEPCDGVAADLNRRGLTTGRGNQWHGRNIVKIVRNPTYAGFRVQRGQVLDGVQGAWPTLVSVADHYRIKAKFDDPERDKFRHPRHVRYLGTGVYRCGRDGCAGRVRTVTERTGIVYYDCSTCHKGRRRVEDVDLVVEAAVIRRLQTVQVAPAQDDSTVEAVARLQAELAEARAGLESGDLSLTDFSAWRKGWQRRMDAAEEAARPSSAPGAMFGVSDVDDWYGLTITQRREIVAFLAEVTILPKRRRGEPFDPELVDVTWR